MNGMQNSLVDYWSNSEHYRRQFQTDDEIETVPTAFQILERFVESLHVRHVAVDENVRSKLLRERSDALLQRHTLIGEGKLGTLLAQCAGDAPRK